MICQHPVSTSVSAMQINGHPFSSSAKKFQKNSKIFQISKISSRWNYGPLIFFTPADRVQSNLALYVLDWLRSRTRFKRKKKHPVSLTSYSACDELEVSNIKHLYSLECLIISISITKLFLFLHSFSLTLPLSYCGSPVSWSVCHTACPFLPSLYFWGLSYEPTICSNLACKYFT